MHPTDNTILITGGTSGIGRALAEAFHARGNQVIIAGRRQALLDEVTAAHPEMHGIRLDLEDPKSVTAFVAQVRDQFPRLNLLVNNAGISRRENLTAGDTDISVAMSIIATNIRGVLEITSALLPTLMRQPSSTIITTTSGLAFVPFAQFPTYCATKAFLHSWLQSLRFQLRETSVEVIELVPPYVQTELSGPQQATDPHAMPLADYIAEVMQLVDNPNPSASEVLVERVKALRFAEKSQNYEQIFWANNNR
ncbi:MAG TPA: SDR family NAD(P)-dependent oxidoreductase [Terracidiphilus sp.]|jgi:uncharacterized oxidoreductase